METKISMITGPPNPLVSTLPHLFDAYRQHFTQLLFDALNARYCVAANRRIHLHSTVYLNGPAHQLNDFKRNAMGRVICSNAWKPVIYLSWCQLGTPVNSPVPIHPHVAGFHGIPCLALNRPFDICSTNRHTVSFPLGAAHFLFFLFLFKQQKRVLWRNRTWHLNLLTTNFIFRVLFISPVHEALVFGKHPKPVFIYFIFPNGLFGFFFSFSFANTWTFLSFTIWF